MGNRREDGSYYEAYYLETPDGINLTKIEYPGDCEVIAEVQGKKAVIIVKKRA